MAGVDAQARGDWRGAAVRFRKVLELEPGWTDATCRLGDVHAADGDLAGALEAWEAAPFNPDCVEAAGRALLEADRPGEALERFQTLNGLSSWDPRVELLLARALAPSDPDAAERAVLRWLTRAAEDSEDLGPAVEAVCAARSDRPEAAIALIDRVVVARPAVADRLAGARDAFEIDARAAERMGASEVPLDPVDRAALDAARRRFALGDHAGALADLEGLANRASRSAELWAALADAREAVGDVEAAERAILLARRLSPETSRYHARHAELLERHFGGRYAAEAASLMGRALEGQEDRAWLARFAELSARAGRWDDARRSWARLAELGDPEAARALAGLDRRRAAPPELPALPPPDGVPPSAWRALHRAWVLRDRRDPEKGDLERALREVDRALAEAPRLSAALALRGELLGSTGDRAGAIRAFREALAAEPDQPDVMATLAELLRQEGRSEEAELMLADAAAAGSASARFQLARRAADEGRWWAARDGLDAYFRVASSGPEHEEARALRSAMDLRIRAAYAALGGTGALLVVAPAAVAWRGRSGVGVAALLQRSPRVFREVARLISSIRHEVLKHAVSALPGAADALEDGDPEPAAWLAGRLYGPDGAIQRFRGYVRELEALGRAHGVALNLRHRDPVFGPLIAAFDRLEGLGTTAGARVSELRSISEALNEVGYAALGRVLRGVCVVPLEPAVFDRALEDVLREPASRGAARPDWSMTGPEGLAVRAWREDLHDVLVNLLRNAVAANREAGRTRLAVRLAVEEDEITGVERVEIRVADEAPRRIDTAMIRGRYIDRGLGLAVDLTSRMGGSIHVEDEAGFSKAVVVRLPREES